jgi:putative resolvase
MRHFPVGEAGLMLGVSVSTMRRWESEGKLIPVYRTPGGHRRYSHEQLQFLIKPEDNIGQAVCYARVSSHDQKEDLVRQSARLSARCEENKIANPLMISDLGSGLNYKKKGLRQLIRLIVNNKVNNLVLTHKDRLLHFGADMLMDICALKNIKVTIIDDVVASSIEQELTQDVIMLMTVFSARLYGSRSHKNMAKAA